jgi:hypothetical protein
MLRSLGTSLFIAALLLAAAIDGLPSLGLFHERARALVQPGLALLGIDQGSWTIFTPRVDRENHDLRCEIEYDTGDVVRWQSADWRKLSAWEKLRRFREMEYGERLYGESNRAVRRAFAHFLARELAPAAGARPRRIVLTYHAALIEPPVEGDHQPRPEWEDHPFETLLYREP